MHGRPLHLYNSYTRQLERFVPIGPTVVRMYSCGLTVYSRGHLGNMRPYVFADTLRRTLLWKGLAVDHVINITDVGHLLADADDGDDKVERAAAREQRSVWDLTEHYQQLFERDLGLLAVLPPRVWTKASDYVPKMIDFAARLEEQGHAYRLSTGLYFDTSTVDNYGVLATIDHAGLEPGARVDMVEGKRHHTDFALWRTFHADEPRRAMEWDSPWGRGAPGWHLECSVMSIDELGDHFDIHTGGVDHREVHHPNEDAQSSAYLGDGQRWVRFWLHNEFVQFGGEKMAKSTGNVLSLDDVAGQGVDPLAYRLLLTQSHYRSPIHVSRKEIAAAGRRLDRLVSVVESRLDELGDVPGPGVTCADVAMSAPVEAIDDAMADDLATPRALAVLGDALRAEPPAVEFAVLLGVARDLLGLDLVALARRRRDTAGERVAQLDRTTRAQIEALIADRDAARRANDFPAADAIRIRLRDEHHVELVDGPHSTTWTVT